MLARNHTAGESLHVQSLAKIKYTCLQLITRDKLNKSTLSSDSTKACEQYSTLPHRLLYNVEPWNTVQCFWAIVWRR